MKGAVPLTVYETGWLYPADQEHGVSSAADAITQNTIPVRTGQRQGLLVGVSNSSEWTQEVLGVDPRWNTGQLSDVQVTVESGAHLGQTGEPQASARYRSPGVIPPGSARVLHISWVSDMCPSPDGQIIITDIPLLVRIGTITKTEDLSFLVTAYALSGGGSPPCH